MRSREHLFLIGLGRAPESHYKQPDGIEPRLQRVLDQLRPAPAFIKTATWDVVAWEPGSRSHLAKTWDRRRVTGATHCEWFSSTRMPRRCITTGRLRHEWLLRVSVQT